MTGPRDWRYLKVGDGFAAGLELVGKAAPRHAPVHHVLRKHAPVFVPAPDQHDAAAVQAAAGRAAVRVPGPQKVANRTPAHLGRIPNKTKKYILTFGKHSLTEEANRLMHSQAMIMDGAERPIGRHINLEKNRPPTFNKRPSGVCAPPHRGDERDAASGRRELRQGAPRAFSAAGFRAVVVVGQVHVCGGRPRPVFEVAPRALGAKVPNTARFCTRPTKEETA